MNKKQIEVEESKVLGNEAIYFVKSSFLFTVI